jgi:ribose 5-phosphate isomerase
VKEVGHGWIVMKKMDIEVPVEISNKELIPLKNKFSDAGIKPKDMGNSNIRLSKKGKITVVDYGNFIMY